MGEQESESPAQPTFAEAFSAAAAKAGIAQVAPGEVPTPRALLAAIGGVRGLIESIVPGLMFLVIYTITGELVISVIAPVVVALVFVVARLGARSPIAAALAGAIGIALTAVLAIMTNRAEDNFLPGIIINAVSLTTLLASIVVRWPLVGVIVGLLAGDGAAWRGDKAKRKVLTIATWLWSALFALRLTIQVPLYLAGRVDWLAATKLVMGLPLYAGLLWITWLLVRSAYARAQPKGDQESLE